MKNRILITSNRLPINISGLPGKLQLQRSNGGVATALSSVLQNYEALWFGWTGTTKYMGRATLRVLGADKRLRPVHVPEKLLHRYYDAFSNGSLWPLLHGLERTIAHEPADYEAYKAVNQRFAKVISKNARPGDTIWIHDYHLLLMPGMLREMGVANKIGFFLHVPFARPDCLDTLVESPELLASLAQVDVLGLHTPRDVDNFSAALKRHGLAMRPGSKLQAFPIGVDYAAYQRTAKQGKVRKFMAQAVPAIAGKHVLLSISRLDYTKGIPEQLQAYEKLLEQTADPEKFMYKLIVAPSREDAPGYKELRVAIDALVRRINKRFGTATYQPVDYTYRNCGFEEVSAWYQLADILLVAPKIDGMNLVVKEFVAARSDNHSMLVISNTIGAAHQLKTALQVDPTNINDIAAKLRQALNMPPEERAPRWQALRHNVKTEDVFWWVKEIMDELESHAQKAVAARMLHMPRLRLSHTASAAKRLLVGSLRRTSRSTTIP